MAEDQDAISKRERQKARRAARRQQEQARAKRQQATSRLTRAIGILVVVGLLGYLIGNWVVDKRTEARLKQEAAARLDELGCTPDAQQPEGPGGTGHIEDPAKVAPRVIYPDRPVSSGPHLGAPLMASGIYEHLVDERVLVHNLEHGYVNIYYAPDAPEEDVEELKRFVRDRLPSKNPKMIVAPKHGEWREDKNFAFLAWRYRQMCDEFDPGVLLSFLDEHYSLAGVAPEKTLPPQLGGRGVVTPADVDEPLLFPPLTAEEPDASPAPAGSSATPSPAGTDAPATATPPAGSPTTASPAPG